MIGPEDPEPDPPTRPRAIHSSRFDCTLPKPAEVVGNVTVKLREATAGGASAEGIGVGCVPEGRDVDAEDVADEREDAVKEEDEAGALADEGEFGFCDLTIRLLCILGFPMMKRIR
jgi:hypothetical protein